MEFSTVPFETWLPKQVSLLYAFAEHRVHYVIVGGYAVRYYGCLRNTHDLDVLIEQSASNVERVIAALTQLGAIHLDKLLLHLLQPEK
jgi:hypothetical protein